MHYKILFSILIYLHERPNGTTFGVAKADCELPRRAVRGDVVTFTHDFSRRSGTHDLQWTHRGVQTRAPPIQQETARGVPANIVVHRIRTDVIWEDVVSAAGHPVRQFHNGLPLSLSDLSSPAFTQVYSHLFQRHTRKLTTQTRHTLVSFYAFLVILTLFILMFYWSAALFFLCLNLDIVYR